MTDYPIGIQGRRHPYHVDTTADHWWPKGLQRLWPNSEGFIYCIDPSGKVKPSKPPKGNKKGFAHKRGGHRVVHGISPWNHSFEPEFDKVDNEGCALVRRIQDEAMLPSSVSAIADGNNFADTLTKFCFSLLLRSPAFRDRYSFAGKAFGLDHNEETGKANIEHFWKSAREIDFDLCNAGRVTLLHSKDVEFCFGDGLYDSIFTRSMSWRPAGEAWIADLVGEAVVPLLPNICAYLHFGRHGLGCDVLAQYVDPRIVQTINHLTQIYSKKMIFYRSAVPELTPEYKKGQHLRINQSSFSVLSLLKAGLGRM